MIASRSVRYTNSCLVRWRAPVGPASGMSQFCASASGYASRPAARSARVFCCTASSARMQAAAEWMARSGPHSERPADANRRAEARDLAPCRRAADRRARRSPSPHGRRRRRRGSRRPRAPGRRRAATPRCRWRRVRRASSNRIGLGFALQDERALRAEEGLVVVVEGVRLDRREHRRAAAGYSNVTYT